MNGNVYDLTEIQSCQLRHRISVQSGRTKLTTDHIFCISEAMEKKCWQNETGH
jgi:hypothetical protein